MKIQRVWPSALLGILCLALQGCTGMPSLETSQLTPLEIRAIETRTYEGADSKAMLKTVLNVLQDESFLVDYGNSDLGLLHASRMIGGATTDQTFGAAIDLFSVKQRNSPTTLLNIEATANVSESGNRIKVRVNFQRRESTVLFTGRTAYSVLGAPYTVTKAIPVTDPRIYQEFFARLDRGVFLQKQGL